MKNTYLCPKCEEELKIDGISVTNEVGRKYCTHCGSNRNNLSIVDSDRYEGALAALDREKK